MKSGDVTEQSFSGSKTVKMFFKLALLCSVLSCVLAAPASTDVVPLEKQQPTVIPIVSQSEELETNGTYKFSYETGNGIKREEISYEKVIPVARSGGSEEGDSSNESNEIHVQQGSYSYVAPDGTVITVKYIADENGFQPVGDHLPRAPVISSEPQTESKNNEKSGRALKPRIKEDKADSESEEVVTPQKVISEEKANTPALEPKESVEKSSPEAPKTEIPQKTEAGESAKVESEASSVTEAAASSEAASETEAATTTAAKDAPVSSTVTASEAASTTESVLATEAATAAVTQGAPEKTTTLLSTEASSASEAISTTASQALETESNPAQPNTESTGSTATEQASSTTTS